MDDAAGCLYLYKSVFSAIFKNHPSLGYKISVSILVLILGAMFIFDQDPSDRVFAIFGIGFVVTVVSGQIFRAIRQQSVQDFQAIDEQALVQ
jgi:hypothetical protein